MATVAGMSPAPSAAQPVAGPGKVPVSLPPVIDRPGVEAVQLVSWPFTAMVVAPPESVSGGENETLAVREHITWPGAGPLNFGGVPCMGSTRVLEVRLPDWPTAVQFVASTQATPPRPEAGGFPRFGLV